MFDYVPLSDPKVLSVLICNRMKLDRSYIEKVYPSGLFSSSGGIVFNESILATYIDLDALIASADLTDKQRAVISLLMKGYTVQDIADECNKDQSAISHLFNRAIEKLVSADTKRWTQVMRGIKRGKSDAENDGESGE